MQVIKEESLPIRTQNDVVIVRQRVRAFAVEIGLGLIDQTKVVTGASELARNTLDYGGGGELKIEVLQIEELRKKGIRLCFEDKGPGIASIEQALTDGYTSGNGLGMGLSGTRRLMNEFSIESKVGEGTRVTCIKWK